MQHSLGFFVILIQKSRRLSIYFFMVISLFLLKEIADATELMLLEKDIPVEYIQRILSP